MNNTLINFMPGPVSIHPDVKKVFQNTFLSHRAKKFYDDVDSFRKQLLSFTKAENVALFVGSGSFGNEVTAMYLKQLNAPGLILVNGEFGKRISEQAREIGLNFHKYEVALGKIFDYDEIENILTTDKNIAWVWFVHCETSTGVLNNMQQLKTICNKRNIKLAADCVSSIANTEVDLSGIYLACTTSGKGIASYAGISMVFFSNDILQLKTQGIPRYMNLQYHVDTHYVPYTISANLFYATVKAFEGVANKEHRTTITQLSARLFTELKALGFSLLCDEKVVMPGIISIVCPPEINSYEFGQELERNYIYVNFGGQYLRKANYFQICLMGHHTDAEIDQFLGFIKKYVKALKTELVKN